MNHCGECEEVCSPLDGASVVCEGGECEFDECDDGFNNCNGDTSDGCETEGDCDCIPGEEQACYTGERGTRNVGACSDGTQVCNDTGSGFGPCEGDVTPIGEVCENLADDDCDGLIDEDEDLDEDGFTACGGDCCDEQGPDCLNPELVNPGAFEAPDNEVDDDCDGEVDEDSPTCDADIAPDTPDADDFARAIDLCQFTEEAPKDPQDATWGVISAELVLTNGAGMPNASSYTVRDGFGANNTNQGGERLVVLSSGRAADNFDDENPS